MTELTRDQCFEQLERANSFYERLVKERDFLLNEFLSEQAELRKVCEERDQLREALQRIDALAPVTCDMKREHEIASEALAATKEKSDD